MAENEKSKGDDLKTVHWVEFLESHPPCSTEYVSDALNKEFNRGEGSAWYLLIPVIRLFCPNSDCEKVSFFDPITNPHEGKFYKSHMNIYLEYSCRHCKKEHKRFSIFTNLTPRKIGEETEMVCEVYKYGEYPTFGPPTPPRVLKLIGPDADLYLSGRRAESQSLGIGAYSYYRRVIDNQWSRLIDEILKVAKSIKSAEEVIRALEQAKGETQFQKAVDGLKDALPPALLINGHNPIKLLYSALSDGLHALSDEECLERATSIRVVLAELAEKLSQALNHEKGLNEAVNKLLNLQNPQNKKNGP